MAPADTVVEAGTVSADALLARLTVAPPAGAALDRLIVQVALALDDRLAVEHWIPDNVVCATSESVAALETPPKDPVIVAVWSKLKADA